VPMDGVHPIEMTQSDVGRAMTGSSFTMSR
jgi:hypothetical protein